MINIEIDEEVFAYLQSNAIAYVETPNQTIKRMLGISKSKKEFTMSKNVKTKKMRKTNLLELISAGLLQENQQLIFQDYQGHKYPDYKVSVFQNSLKWNNKSFSMSELAKILLKKLGYESDSVRGPIFWYTLGGISIKDIWTGYKK